jgi:hypothetical protein
MPRPSAPDQSDAIDPKLPFGVLGPKQRGGKPTSLRRAKSPRPRAVRGRLSRPLAGKLLAVGLSEDPPDDFVGMRIETSAMAKQNTLRLP